MFNLIILVVQNKLISKRSLLLMKFLKIIVLPLEFIIFLSFFKMVLLKDFAFNLIKDFFPTAYFFMTKAFLLNLLIQLLIYQYIAYTKFQFTM